MWKVEKFLIQFNNVVNKVICDDSTSSSENMFNTTDIIKHTKESNKSTSSEASFSNYTNYINLATTDSKWNKAQLTFKTKELVNRRAWHQPKSQVYAWQKQSNVRENRNISVEHFFLETNLAPGKYSRSNKWYCFTLAYSTLHGRGLSNKIINAITRQFKYWHWILWGSHTILSVLAQIFSQFFD